MLSLFGAGAVGANLTAHFAGDTASIVADGIADANLQALLRAFKTTSNDNASAKAMGNKIADAAEMFANGTGGSPATKVADVNSAALADKTKAKILAHWAIATANGGARQQHLGADEAGDGVGDRRSGQRSAPTAAEVSVKKAASALASGQIIGAMVASAAASSKRRLLGRRRDDDWHPRQRARRVRRDGERQQQDVQGPARSAWARPRSRSSRRRWRPSTRRRPASATRRLSKKTGDAAACGEKAKIADLGAMPASARGATNMAAQSATQAITRDLDAERSPAGDAHGRGGGRIEHPGRED